MAGIISCVILGRLFWKPCSADEQTPRVEVLTVGILGIGRSTKHFDTEHMIVCLSDALCTQAGM